MFLTDDEIKEWLDKGIEDEYIAQRWSLLGFNLEETLQWRSLNLEPETAIDWKHSSIPFEEVPKFIEYELTPNDYSNWNSYGYVTPELILEWKLKGFEPLETYYWAAANFTAEEALEWKKFEFTPDEAFILKGANISPEDAYEWKFQLGYWLPVEVEEIVEFHNSPYKIEDIVTFYQRGYKITPQQLTDQIEREKRQAQKLAESKKKEEPKKYKTKRRNLKTKIIRQ